MNYSELKENGRVNGLELGMVNCPSSSDERDRPIEVYGLQVGLLGSVAQIESECLQLGIYNEVSNGEDNSGKRRALAIQPNF